MKFFKYPVTDIPDIFLPYGQSDPFTHCINCNTYLLQNDTEYVVEKAIRHYQKLDASDVIFEYAMCMNCAEQIRKELSHESLQAIQRFMADSRMLDSRQRLIKENNWNIDDWLSHCAVNGQKIEDQDEYQIFAHCRGDQLVFSAMPYMISGAAVEEMSELLSAKTRDELDRFVDDNFGLPPELKQPIKDNPVIMF